MAALAQSRKEEVFGKWCPPCPPDKPQLMIYNSLTRTKVPFVPMDPLGKVITMYVCGPTVYDAAHLGHARTYLQFDVMRRILRDALGYDVNYVMNVTDVDDKIIMRSAERGVSPETLAREWEHAFLEDMTALGVERPTSMPRVTEYVPEIVAFVEKIVANGFAYADQGSVYFDTVAFGRAGYDYGKLVPESIGSAELMAESEGKLGILLGGGKKDPRDFALWKASKPGEPTWPSPWGDGRPGWHIECSAMIDNTIGSGGLGGAAGCIDIHGGGVDLRFPHHDNELAQGEAFCACKQTVNYFAHTGHLHIRGLKMSKSLKNFITIGQALAGLEGVEGSEPVHPRTMRLMFCLVSYNAPCDYSDNMLANARVVEKKFKEYFLNVAAALRPLDADPDSRQKLCAEDKELLAALKKAQDTVYARFLDDFDTPGAVLALQTLVDTTSAYLQKFDAKQASRAVPCSLALCATARYVGETLDLLGLEGLCADDVLRRLKLTPSHKPAAALGSGDAAAALGPLLDVIAAFRDDVRAAGREGDTQKVLALCDALRDDALPALGVRLEDKGAASVWKLEDPAVLAAEKQLKALELANREEAKRLDAAKKAAKEAAASVRPQDMFKDRETKYAAFDADGVPTHDAANEPLSKSLLKKLKKEWEKQKKLYDKAQGN